MQWLDPAGFYASYETEDLTASKCVDIDLVEVTLFSFVSWFIKLSVEGTLVEESRTYSYRPSSAEVHRWAQDCISRNNDKLTELGVIDREVHYYDEQDEL